MKQESSGLEKGNIGGYRLLAELGKGATARVFRVEQPGGKDVYALKYGSCKARLRAESAILKQLRHPCFPRWIDEGEDAGGIYLVMEFIPGLSLHISGFESIQCGDHSPGQGPAGGPGGCSPVGRLRSGRSGGNLWIRCAGTVLGRRRNYALLRYLWVWKTAGLLADRAGPGETAL